MNFEGFEIRHLELPLRNPFETGFGVIEDRNLVLLSGEDSQGRRFYGEASAQFAPLYNHETTDSVMDFLQDFAVPVLHEAESAVEYRQKISRYRDNRIAKSAGEMLLYHRRMVERDISLRDLFDVERTEVECGVSIGIQENPEELVDQVAKFREEGYRRAKIKVKPGEDLGFVEAVRKEFPDYDLMVDANSSYTLDDLDRLKRMDRYDLSMIEQPLGHRDLLNHSELADRLKTPLCLDESIRTAEDVKKAARLDACDIVNLKPQRVGGITESRRINSVCERNDISLWIGGLVESGIGAMYQLAAAGMSQVNHPSDIAPQSRYFSEQLMEKPEMKDGCIRIPSEPGFSSKIDCQKLEKLTERKIQV